MVDIQNLAPSHHHGPDAVHHQSLCLHNLYLKVNNFQFLIMMNLDNPFLPPTLVIFCQNWSIHQCFPRNHCWLHLVLFSFCLQSLACFGFGLEIGSPCLACLGQVLAANLRAVRFAQVCWERWRLGCLCCKIRNQKVVGRNLVLLLQLAVVGITFPQPPAPFFHRPKTMAQQPAHSF